jgi:hypothetical protein
MIHTIADELAAALREVYREDTLKAHSNAVIEKAIAKYEAAKAEEKPLFDNGDFPAVFDAPKSNRETIPKAKEPSDLVKAIEIVQSLKRPKLDSPFDQSQDRRDIKVWNNACDTIIGFLKSADSVLAPEDGMHP